MKFAHSTYLIGCVARNSNVIVTLEYKLNVTDVELRGLAKFGKFAGGADDCVDEVISELEHRLRAFRVSG